MRERNAYSLETLLEDMEVDNPKEEAKRIIGEQAAIAQAQQQAKASEQQADLQGKVAVEKVKGEEKLKQIKLEQEMEAIKELEIEKLRLQNSNEQSKKTDSAA